MLKVMKRISLLLETSLLITLPCCCLAWSPPPFRRTVISPPASFMNLLVSSPRKSQNGYDACKAANTEEIEEDASQDNISQQILSLALPALVSLAIDPLMTIADTAFVGRYSAPNDPYPLAGLGSAAALLVFSFYVFNFLATATAPLVANRRASSDEAGAKQVGGQALSLAFVLGTALTLILLLFRTSLLHIMGTSVTGPEADHYGEQFLTVRALAAPAVLVCSASNGILRGYLDTKTPTIILLGSNAINLLLDVVLVAQLKIGPQGAGIATTVAEWIAALCFLGVLAGKLPNADGKKMGSPEGGVVPVFELPNWMDIRPLVVASSAVFLRSIVLQVAMSSAAAMAARAAGESGIITSGASSSVAAHQIALQLWLLCSFLCDALACASQALVADGIGRKDADAVRIVSQTVFNWALVLGLTLSACIWVGTDSNFLIDFFTSDEGTRIELAKLLTIVILAQPLNSFVFAADGVLQGAEEFSYQAKSMAVSVVTAFSVFGMLEHAPFLGENKDTLVNVWLGLIALQSMRAFTSLVKLIEQQGPINLLGKKVS